MIGSTRLLFLVKAQRDWVMFMLHSTTQMEENPLGAKFCCCQLTKIFRAPPKQLATSPPEQPESFLLTTTRWRWCPLTTHQKPPVVTECFFRKVLETEGLEMFFFCRTKPSKVWSNRPINALDTEDRYRR